MWIFTWQQAAWCRGEVPPTPTPPADPAPSCRKRARSTLARVGESSREGVALPGVEHPASTTSMLLGPQLTHNRPYSSNRPRHTELRFQWPSTGRATQRPVTEPLTRPNLKWSLPAPNYSFTLVSVSSTVT